MDDMDLGDKIILFFAFIAFWAVAAWVVIDLDSVLLATILGFVAAIVISFVGFYLKSFLKTSNKVRLYGALAIVVVVAILGLCLSQCGFNGERERSWGDLSKQEQKNAKWAHEVHEYIYK